MTDSPERQQPDPRERLVAYLLLALAIVWAVARTWRSMAMLFDRSHDLDIYYSLWFLLAHRDYAALALSQALYLPHTWFVLTPLFALGWPAARALMLLLNIASILFLWRRLSNLAGLTGPRRCLLLAFFSGWLGTGLILGLGNLALVCVAAAVASYPFKSVTNSIFLTLSAMKQSLIFPLYFHLLLKRPKTLVMPFATFAVCGVTLLIWAKLGPTDIPNLLQGPGHVAGDWTLYDFTHMRRLFTPFMKTGIVLTIIIWVIWFGVFGVCMRYIKEPLAKLSALLLLSLLPMYHQKYDLVAAVPMLAILLRRCSLMWPTLMSISLATDVGASFSRHLPAGAARHAGEMLEQAYYPVLILVFLAGLICLEVKARPEVSKDAPPATVNS